MEFFRIELRRARGNYTARGDIRFANFYLFVFFLMFLLGIYLVWYFQFSRHASTTPRVHVEPR